MPTDPPSGANSLYFLKKQPRQARAVATVDAILDAAAQLLIEAGWDACSTNRIAAHAGVSIGSLYEYFPGKDAVFAELRRRHGRKWYEALMREPRPTAPAEVIRYLVTNRVAFVLDNPTLYVALETQVPRSAVADLEAEVFADFKQASVAYFVAHEQELREFSDHAQLAEFLMRTVSATVHDYAVHAPEQLAQPGVTQGLIDMLERYLLPAGGYCGG